MAYYTGSRIGTVLTASFHVGAGRSYIDLERGLFFRLPEGKRETAKRQPPCKLGFRIKAHLSRWKRLGFHYVVEWQAKPIGSIKTGFERAVILSGLTDPDLIVPHTLRHSRVTHLKQAGVPTPEVADAVGMSQKMVEDVYGHWDPGFMERAANAR